MTPETARTALLFMQRASLNGSEVPAFVNVCRELEKIANIPSKPPEAANQ